MGKNWTLGNLFRKEREESDQHIDVTFLSDIKDEYVPRSKGNAKAASDENIVYMPEMGEATRKLWEMWTQSTMPPLLQLEASPTAQDKERALRRLEDARDSLILQLEKDAQKRLHEIEQRKDSEKFSLNSDCTVYLSKDKMLAWAFFFPPYGPEGVFEVSALGRALQAANVTTGIDPAKVVRLLQEQTYFEMIPIAEGTEAVEGKSGSIIELFSREQPKEVIMDLDGVADYRAQNYVRQIKKNDRICNIVLPEKGTPGVQVDGKVVEPKAIKMPNVPGGINTAVSENGLHLIATRDGHLEFANGRFHVRPVLEIKGDVDYATGNIEFNGDIHIYGDVREGFEVRATGTITIDGLVEGAMVEAGGDLIISRGVVGDHRALLRSKGCVRVKYLENCALYAGKTIYADCIMTSQIFSDDTINVTSGRGSIIGGTMTAAYSIRANMVGAHSGRRTELTLGALPYIQTELQNIEEELTTLRTEISKIGRDLMFLEGVGGLGSDDPRLTKMRMRRSMLTMKEKKLVSQQEKLSPIHPELSKCRFEAGVVHPVTALTIQNDTWVVREIRHRCRLIYDVNNEKIKEII